MDGASVSASSDPEYDMNNVDRIFHNHAGPEAFTSAYTEYFARVLGTLDKRAVAAVIEAMLGAREKGRRIFFIGNGGSAATASHFANDVAIGTRCAAKPFRAISLTDNH